jgi:hypothetical protein
MNLPAQNFKERATMTDYWWSEEDVTQHMGITKRELKTLRKEQLQPIEHYEIVEGKHRFSKSGLLALCAFVKVDPPAGMEEYKKAAPAANGETEQVDFVIERICPNPTWVIGRVVDATGPIGTERIKCRVRNNAYLHFRQKIRAIRNGDHFKEVRVRA